MKIYISEAQFWSEWLIGLDSARQVTAVKVGKVRSNSGWVTSKA